MASAAEIQLALIRDEINRYGKSTVGCDRLLVLVSSRAPISSQFSHIFAVAEKENWSLEFRPDGTVCFSPLPAARPGVNESPFQQEANRAIRKSA
jgi:hypothetical protein